MQKVQKLAAKTTPKILFFHIPFGLLTLLIGIFTALSVLLFIGRTQGVRISAIRTGSMEPAIKRGSIILTKQTENYSAGDIVTYRAVNENTGVDLKTYITHRIVTYMPVNQTILALVKGDANITPDEKLIASEQIVGKVFFVIPFVGHVWVFLQTSLGFLFLILIPAASLVIYAALLLTEKQSGSVTLKNVVRGLQK